MAATNNSPIDWDGFLRNIKCKNVIPVTGKQLYRVDIESEGKKNYPLYKYLTEKVSKRSDNFENACQQFLEENNNDYLYLSELLHEQLQNVRLPQENPLKKLARTKSFNLFLTTAYDNLLTRVLEQVRTSPTETLSYTKSEKGDIESLNHEAFKSIRKSERNPVLHLFGNFQSVRPAYTEQSIIESIIEFNKNIEKNEFGENLINHNLIFLGFTPDDWLFRYLIYTLSSIAYENKNFRLLIGNNFLDINNHREPFQQLLLFLKEHYAIGFYPTAGDDFVDLLFEKVSEKYPEEVIQPDEFPGKVFISYESKDEEAAERLAKRLRRSKIDVWFDKYNMRGGDKVDEKINKAINNSSAFIALTSKNSRKIETKAGKLKYHILEWVIAYSKSLNDKNFRIIPVILDSWDNVYEKFTGFSGYKIPNGTDGEYEKLKEELKEIQEKYYG
jgi:hypothetical protein